MDQTATHNGSSLNNLGGNMRRNNPIILRMLCFMSLWVVGYLFFILALAFYYPSLLIAQ